MQMTSVPETGKLVKQGKTNKESEAQAAHRAMQKNRRCFDPWTGA